MKPYYIEIEYNEWSLLWDVRAKYKTKSGYALLKKSIETIGELTEVQKIIQKLMEDENL